MTQTVCVLGAGLAGCEAAWQIASRGVQVRLYEMKPSKYTPAHHSPQFAELVCSNSLRSDSLQSAVGLLKEEMRRCGSLILEAADATRVPAGSALAVDRELFSSYITEKIQSHPLITVVEEEVAAIPDEGITVVATGFDSEYYRELEAKRLAEQQEKEAAEVAARQLAEAERLKKEQEAAATETPAATTPAPALETSDFTANNKGNIWDAIDKPQPEEYLDIPPSLRSRLKR